MDWPMHDLIMFAFGAASGFAAGRLWAYLRQSTS